MTAAVSVCISNAQSLMWRRFWVVPSDLHTDRSFLHLLAFWICNWSFILLSNLPVYLALQLLRLYQYILLPCKHWYLLPNASIKCSSWSNCIKSNTSSAQTHALPPLSSHMRVFSSLRLHRDQPCSNAAKYGWYCVSLFVFITNYDELLIKAWIINISIGWFNRYLLKNPDLSIPAV